MPDEANRVTSDCCSLVRWLSGTGATRGPAACDETWKTSAAITTNDACLMLIARSFEMMGASDASTCLASAQRVDVPPVPGRGDVGFAGAARFLEKNGRTRVSICSRTLLVWSPSYSS